MHFHSLLLMAISNVSKYEHLMYLSCLSASLLSASPALEQCNWSKVSLHALIKPSYPVQGHRGWCQSQLTLSKRHTKPWTDSQSITMSLCACRVTPTINLVWTIWIVGGNSSNLVETQASTKRAERTCKVSKETFQLTARFEPRTLWHITVPGWRSCTIIKLHSLPGKQWVSFHRVCEFYSFNAGRVCDCR